MPRRSRALAALALVVLLAGCGSREATRGSVRDTVRDRLAERDDPITGDAADEIAECVSNGLFDPDQFTPEERDEATSASGEDPDPDLAARVEALVNDCIATAGNGGADDTTGTTGSADASDG